MDPDDGFTADNSATGGDKIVFFSEKSFKNEESSKSQMKAFMVSPDSGREITSQSSGHPSSVVESFEVER